MKKIFLLLLILVFGFISYGQKRAIGDPFDVISTDGKLKAISYRELKEKGEGLMPYEVWESSTIEIYRKDKLLKTLDIHDMMESYRGHRYYVGIMGFNSDGSKLYFSSRLVTYEYDIVKDKFKKLFEDFNTRVSVNKIVGDTLCIRNVTKVNTWGDKFWKYCDGTYTEYTPEQYFSQQKGILVKKM